ncbi:MAG: histidinol dehydrogenase [Oscillospiraceae bacterium]|nr:histidinol dehydrogenase [Oscillospiraceae bacterium]
MLEITRSSAAGAAALVASLRARNDEQNEKITAAAAAIMEDVRVRGFEAVREYSVRFDKAEPRELTEAELDAAVAACPKELIAALERAARNIEDYQRRLLPVSSSWEVPGGRLGQTVRGLSRVGIYVPGGVGAYPSSVLMNAVPARVAGVEEIIMVTPPTANLNAAVMAAARIAGVDRVLAVGGAQAVAALTYGAGFIPRVDKLVGPGNAYVAAAKRLAFGQVDIDMVAGPSEVLVIADETADPAWVAADLLSQAEHGDLAGTVLVSTNEELAKAVAAEIERQTALLTRREIVEHSLTGFAALIVTDTIEDAAALANEVAPEHCEIMTAEPRAVLPLIKNAGAIFLGRYSPEPLGDYMAGPSHVLPTSGTARFFSPLSVESFIKRTSVIEFTKDGLEALSDDIIRLADAEGFGAHAASIAIRREEK